MVERIIYIGIGFFVAYLLGQIRVWMIRNQIKTLHKKYSDIALESEAYLTYPDLDRVANKLIIIEKESGVKALKSVCNDLKEIID
ncbi:hypothetical protein [Ammoniphilus resinae]|uniref:Uncharacterized protein n=1 Tax=Ammoniphilus resinae TaxID=861532 RepID=A0ABS4GNJ8_9BACL|nr:hypothetical protein [Ammoniphilus resinae]MBP1931834.1 hypothetical protein [Ammoniphilus resinae]